MNLLFNITFFFQELVDISHQDQIAPGMVPLVEGHPLIVPVSWLHDVQGLIKGKTRTNAIKLIMSGFYKPCDVVGKSGRDLADTHVGRSLKGIF